MPEQNGSYFADDISPLHCLAEKSLEIHIGLFRLFEGMKEKMRYRWFREWLGTDVYPC